MDAYSILAWAIPTALLLMIGFAGVVPEIWNMARVTLFGSPNTDASGTFDVSRDVPSMAGKVILITGAAGDLGRQAAIELAKHGRPARLYIADLPRDLAAQRLAIDRIIEGAYGKSGRLEETDSLTPETEVRFLPLDLASFQSIRACAAEFLAKEKRLDVLLLNAGILRVAPEKTKEGYELHFGLNYLGHALLARLLVPTMVHTAHEHPGADVRLIAVSSEGHMMAPKAGIQFDNLKTTCAKMWYLQRYGQSKLALIAFVRELAHHYPELRTAAVHPGRVHTGMATGLAKESLLVRLTGPLAPFICVAVSVGVLNHVWAATSPDVVSGTYYEPVGIPNKESVIAKDRMLSARLWEWTEGELKNVNALA